MKKFIPIVVLLLSLCPKAEAQWWSAVFGNEPLKISIVLPFSLDSDNPSTDFLDFYSGALSAVESQRSRGRDLDIDVIDFKQFGRSNESVALLSERLKGRDLVIGPANAADIRVVANICKELEIPVVSPLDRNAEALVEGNPYFFQVPVPKDWQIANMIRNIDPYGGTVTVFQSENPDDEYATMVRAALEDAGIGYRTMSYQIAKGIEMSEKLLPSFANGTHHQVIIACEEEAFASDVIRNLNLIARTVDGFEVYASGRIRNFDTIEQDALHNLDVHIFSPYYVDYQDTDTHNFILRYRSLYHTEPTAFSFSGYDITSFFISALCDLRGTFLYYIDYYTMQMTQGSFRFVRKNEGSGYINIRTRDVEYRPDGTTVVY